MIGRWIGPAWLVAGVVLTGCAQTFDATDVGVPVALASEAGTAPAGQPFKISTHTIHGLWGLVSLKEAALDQALAGQLVGGAAVADLKIKTKTSFWDIFFTVITAGLIAPRSVTYEGTVVGR